MNVDSVLFIGCFLPVVLILYWLIPAEKFRKYLLLIAGLVFYAFSGLAGILVLLGAAAVTYLFGLGILAGKRAKGFCVAAVVVNLLLLGVYKYLDFLLAELLGQPALHLGIVAPLGISFYCFKCISYTVDTYRCRENGTKRFLELLLYVSFFPQLTAGPISRFPHFRNQLCAAAADGEKIARGIRRFVVGLGKKLILAGTVAKISDSIFAMELGAVGFHHAWLGAIAYMLQIYFDFSGYSDMAIGLGNAFGFETPENFCHPYAAVSVTDFWRRWHISLSSWFKNYLYIPLGGNRRGTWRKGLNKLIVFLLCGIWHGAAWTFVLWGLWHGLLSACESIRPVRGKFLSRLYTLLAVCLGFVMFRAGTVEQGFSMIKIMFTGISFAGLAGRLAEGLVTVEGFWALLVGAVLALPVVPWLKRNAWIQKFWEPIAYIGCVLLFVLCLMKLASGGFAPFIYAQF